MPDDITDNEGCIEFSFDGENLPNLKGNGPSLTIQPSIGDVIIFPSSLNHRTSPFNSKEKRICIAFDLNPR